VDDLLKSVLHLHPSGDQLDSLIHLCYVVFFLANVYVLLYLNEQVDDLDSKQYLIQLNM
jgi:hypothetical protein